MNSRSGVKNSDGLNVADRRTGAWIVIGNDANQGRRRWDGAWLSPGGLGVPSMSGGSRRHVNYCRKVFSAGLMMLLAGCSLVSPFDRVLLQRAASGPTPIDIADSPARQRGGMVLWGGRIADVRVLERDLEIGIHAFPLDAQGEPREDDSFQGRFAARYGFSTEAYRYVPGRRITIYGRVDSVAEVPVARTTQTVPVVTPIQTHLWDDPGAPPGFSVWPFWHFNIQIMGGF